MAGDVNLFLHDTDDPFNAEIEIMIAEEKYRRKGFAKESLFIMMRYGIEKLKITRFFSKISENNKASINLFLRYFILFLISIILYIVNLNISFVIIIIIVLVIKKLIMLKHLVNMN
jgi:hypothetical protein